MGWNAMVKVKGSGSPFRHPWHPALVSILKSCPASRAPAEHRKAEVLK
jgi:hypothetical protein